jgi:hypothetical protein
MGRLATGHGVPGLMKTIAREAGRTHVRSGPALPVVAGRATS